MTGDLNCWFELIHKKLVYPAKSLSSLGSIQRRLVKRGPTVLLFSGGVRLIGPDKSTKAHCAQVVLLYVGVYVLRNVC